MMYESFNEEENEDEINNEERKRPDVERIYRNDQIAVYWEPKLCIHAGNCFRGLPEVFKPQSRPWVLVDAATADQIAEVVMTCPTGACTSSGSMMAHRSRDQMKPLSTRGRTVRCMSEVKCESQDQAAA